MAMLPASSSRVFLGIFFLVFFCSIIFFFFIPLCFFFLFNPPVKEVRAYGHRDGQEGRRRRDQSRKKQGDTKATCEGNGTQLQEWRSFRKRIRNENIGIVSGISVLNKQEQSLDQHRRATRPPSLPVHCGESRRTEERLVARGREADEETRRFRYIKKRSIGVGGERTREVVGVVVGVVVVEVKLDANPL